LTFHQDKEGNMIGGGYQVNNLLYQHKTPLFVSFGNNTDGQSMTGGAGGDSRIHSSDESENRHFIPEKFSDLFRDLAVPAGLFVMPPQFKPRNYVFEAPEQDTVTKTHTQTKTKTKTTREGDDTDTDTDTDTDDEGRTKPVPTDIFDTLLSLVTPTERIQHDVKTRRRRRRSRESVNDNKEKKRHNKTKRSALSS
jgi:hypothetical protein